MTLPRMGFMAALAATTGLLLGCEAREVEPPGDVPPMTATDPAAERQFIRLTGCVLPDAEPGRYVLTAVATAGVMGDAAVPDEPARSWTTDAEPTAEGLGALKADSTYQLIPTEDQNLAEFANQRAVVRGILAHEVPEARRGTTGEEAEEGIGEGTEVARGPAGSKVVADAPPPPVRGLHVESIDRVAESCR